MPPQPQKLVETTTVCLRAVNSSSEHRVGSVILIFVVLKYFNKNVFNFVR